MISFARGPSLNEWVRARGVAAFRPKTFVSERDMMAKKGLLEQPDETEPWRIRKERTRSYVWKISHGPRIKIGDGCIHPIDMITPAELALEDPCLPSALLATTLRSGCADYWGGQQRQIERLRYSHLRPLSEYGVARISILTNRTSAFKLFETTYPIRPILTKLSPS